MANSKQNYNRHIVQRPDGSWANLKAGNDRATSLHNTQAAAINAARNDLKQSGGGELVIHGVDGKIRSKDTVPPANDPFPPPG